MIDIDMIYDIWSTKKKNVKSFFSLILLDFMIWLVIMVRLIKIFSVNFFSEYGFFMGVQKQVHPLRLYFHYAPGVQMMQLMLQFFFIVMFILIFVDFSV